MISVQKDIKTVYESMKPILLLSKLAGVCTLTSKKHIEEVGRSKLLTVIQILILLISMAHLGFIPYAVIYIEEMPEISLKLNSTLEQTGALSSQKFITKMANIVLISIMSILVRFSNLIHMPKYLPPLLVEIQNVDIIIPSLDNSDFRRNIILSMLLLIVSWPYQIYSILIVTTDNWMAFLMFYLNLYNNFSIISCEFQFASLCWIVQSRFERLIHNLEDIHNKHYIENGNLVLTKLATTKRYTRLMTKAFSKLNKLHGFQLLVILAGLSLNVLFGLYFTIFGGFTKNSNKTSATFQKISNVINEVLWSVYYLARFVFICVVAEIVTHKANTPKKIICNILNKTSSEHLQQELWTFLSHTMVNKLVFTASGFFRINKALITSAVSMGTTYLVILAQFQNK
ncbi:putative gustatory receptor 28b [Diabrotica virgifera virgifera]|uniref:Gustatory receptor n=1 Tax=Diabrotica virgifera virgifera TaxID=50390 RepID=A0ABM5IKZ9_DIAVI|nr:putative gustatory receptor 28b [Diabrotica virgifera virgifera]